VDGSDREELFDGWAETYDRSVRDQRGFPFEGYEQVLDEVVRQAGVAPGARILDVGIGTGNLAERLVRAGADVWGSDFSEEMLDRARERLPGIHAVKADLRAATIGHEGLFDRIVSAYVFHEFPLDEKVRLLRMLAGDHLGEDGRIVIGDISFPTAARREAEERAAAGDWDPEEDYWAADEALPALEEAGFVAAYAQVSFCAGVYSIRPRA
jgi:putative AdoMet-dependent methyltransferase